ncbi:MAG: N-acetyltransferase [Syntrophomonadaceae bacterium]|nr:N-acetyltransferase [Syntrophomonadaceae bacterium]
MTGYSIVSLKDMIDELGEKKIKEILSQFSCSLNADVESFLHNSAIELAKQGVSATHLVFTPYKNSPVIAGYFTLASKNIIVSQKSISNSLRKRIAKFGTYDPDRKGYIIAAPLIAQLGKNYTNNYNDLISGDEILSMACKQVSKVQQIIGGKIVYLECEDKPSLIKFYNDNGFVNFGQRKLDRDETELLSGQYLIQMLKYL